MPISATGNRPARDAAFTLVEALIAIGVIALMAGLVLLSTPGPEQRLVNTAERFAAFVARGGEDSVMTNRTLALRVTDEGYGFQERSDEGWRALASDHPLAFRPWPSGTSVRIARADGAESEHATIFDVLGEADPVAITLSQAGAAVRVAVNDQGGVDVAPAP